MFCDGRVVPTLLVQRELMKRLDEVYLREHRGAVDLRDDFLNRFTRKSDPSDRFVERLGVTREPNLQRVLRTLVPPIGVSRLVLGHHN